MSSPERHVEDALERLVRSINGQADDSTLLLARQIVSSSYGERSAERGLSSTWRRIERSTSPSTRKEVEALYEKLCQVSDPQLAERVLLVLSKVASKSVGKGRHGSTALSQSSLSISNGGIEMPIYDRKILAEQVEREETMLLRECLYALQGMDGERIRYYWTKDTEDSITDGIRIRSNPLLESAALDPDIPTRLGSGADDALRMCGEAGWLHHRIQAYIKEHTANESHGIVSRAFAGALSSNLQDYYWLLASIESELPSSGLTLRQLLVDLRGTTTRLRTMAMVTDGIAHLSGGQLLSALYRHSLHGDTRHASLVQQLLSSASQPWFHLLYLWTTQGVLVDPHDEFFIQEHDEVDEMHMWRDRYTIRNDQIIPNGILDQELVRPAWILGKGINFIRKCLLDTEWRMDLGDPTTSTTDDDERRVRLGYQYVPQAGFAHPSASILQRTLLRAGEQVHSHILKSLRDDHHLMDHLWGLKQFLFLGQGDFFSAFMDGMHAEMEGRQGLAGIYKHSIMGIMDTAIMDTNARELPSHVLERVRVEVTVDKDDDAYYQFAPPRDVEVDDKRSGWDVVLMDYVVPETLAAIVDESALKRYKLVFVLLFRLKRVEFMLNSTWRQSTALHHALQTFTQHNAIQVTTSAGYSLVMVLLRKISMARQSMMHFVGNLKSYFMFEVLEGGWKQLVREIDSAKTLDEVIEAHDRYLSGIVRKSLLGGVAKLATTESEMALATRLQELLTIATAFCALQENLFSDALAAVERAGEKRREAERRMTEGKWGFNREEDFREEDTFFGLTDVATSKDVDRILEEFNEKTVLLLDGLYAAVNGTLAASTTIEITSPATPSSRAKGSKAQSTWTRSEAEAISDPFDHDSLRFLTFQLDYSEFYSNIQASGSKKKQSQ